MGFAKNEKEWVVLDLLSGLILENVEGCVVDIGIGLSTKVLAKYSEKFGREHYSCDISKKVIRRYGGCSHGKHFIYRGDMREFIFQFNKIVALVFLDGLHQFDHNLEAVTKFLTLMNPGGVIFLHDTYPPSEKVLKENGGKCGEVYRVRQVLEKQDSVWTFTWPYLKQAQGCGLTMVMKKEVGRPYYQM